MTTPQQLATKIMRSNPDHFPAGRLLADLGITDDMAVPDRQRLAAAIEAGVRPLDTFFDRLGIEVDEIDRLWTGRGMIRVLLGPDAPTLSRIVDNMEPPVRDRVVELGRAWWAGVERLAKS